MAWVYRLGLKGARLIWRVTRPRTFGARVIAHDGGARIVLVRHSYVPGWAFPGGGVKKGESAPRAALRELAEEAGIADAAIERVHGIFHTRAEGKDDHIALFVVRVPAGTPAHAADAREIVEARWFALDALPDDVSPATLRRIAEYREGRAGWGAW